ncbi:hypothetical protein ACX1N5_15655 [Acinetobacter sp. ANC 4636]
MNLLPLLDIKSIIASLFSGGFVLTVAWVYKIYNNFQDGKKLKTLVYYEIYILNKHLEDLVNIACGSEKEGWFRNPCVLAMDLTLFNNQQIQKTIVGLKAEEILNIISFYNFYKSIDSKLQIYSVHLKEKMVVQKNINNNQEVKSYEELCQNTTNVLKDDFKEIKKIYLNLSSTSDFKKVAQKLELS